MKREKKFTAGPWSVAHEHNSAIGGDVILVHADGEEVVDVIGVINEPDAHLIATAPELLEALEEAVNFSRDVYGGNHTRSQHIKLDKALSAAIAKAYGEES